MESQFISISPPERLQSSTWPPVDLDGLKPFDEAVLSWDVMSNGGQMEFLVRVQGQEFHMGRWSLESGRTSINKQEYAVGRVATDTLVLKQPATSISVQVRLTPAPDGTMPQIRKLHLNTTLGEPATSYAVPDALAPLDVPRRCQADYPGGGVLCSPTSVSMVLNYWANQLSRPQLDQDVPLVQKGVFDPAWGGTGNWPFNTAFATAQPGIRAYVTRLRNLDDLTAWVRSGVPVVTSIAYGLLKGKEAREPNDGHLIVVVGFDEDGNVIVNDPGRRDVRLVYKTRDFVRAWATSRNTVYIIHPEYWVVPAPFGGPWMS